MDVKEIIARNIVSLRKYNKLTQIELAEKINYSDKAVSRWESGTVTPDIETLIKLSSVFGVPIQRLWSEDLDYVVMEKEQKQRKINKLIIALLAMAIVWTMATIIYVYSILFDGSYNWKIFIYAFPATFLVALIFNAVWGAKKLNIVLASALIWTILLSVYIYTLGYNMWPIFVLGVPLQVVAILWSKLRN